MSDPLDRDDPFDLKGMLAHMQLAEAALELAEAWWAWRKAPVLTVEEAEANLRRRHAEEAFAKIKREQGGGA